MNKKKSRTAFACSIYTFRRSSRFSACIEFRGTINEFGQVGRVSKNGGKI